MELVGKKGFGGEERESEKIMGRIGSYCMYHTCKVCVYEIVKE